MSALARRSVPGDAAGTLVAPLRTAAAHSRSMRTGPGGAGPLEFDHAITYVTKIKRRFANDPETYKSFLQILHTYQRQQRSIKEVLERVSVLFRDHPDLLKDFTYFLPETVQVSVRGSWARARLLLTAAGAPPPRPSLAADAGQRSHDSYR